ncbi:AsnC family transcriptional regulator [Marinicauda pacifica]|uniref:Lrp/AsnC family transcriptional regulator n=1 Tax=Marinicauda pacifica TaxID=1133559 RepID=A0A4S2HB06_9PROT|nr:MULTISPECIES: Lrp/AsnC family transcriptional regulator [Marinicauda]TGY92943.1 Lrp/AsnC family transcriptional regulator [Marinicauda pacifica]GGE41559.1 AsnC family transcriptional regulator [Marinicauda pacifica]
MPQGLDEIDVRILKALQEDCSISTAELADRVGLSQSPCWRRIQRLREDGFIRAQVALLDAEKLGYSLHVFAQLKTSYLADSDREKFIRSVASIPEVVECYSVLGERDVLIKVIAPDIKWYQEFIFNTILKLPGVEDISSIVALSEMKHTTALPVRVTKE